MRSRYERPGIYLPFIWMLQMLFVNALPATTGTAPRVDHMEVSLSSDGVVEQISVQPHQASDEDAAPLTRGRTKSYDKIKALLSQDATPTFEVKAVPSVRRESSVSSASHSKEPPVPSTQMTALDHQEVSAATASEEVPCDAASVLADPEHASVVPDEDKDTSPCAQMREQMKPKVLENHVIAKDPETGEKVQIPSEEVVVHKDNASQDKFMWVVGAATTLVLSCVFCTLFVAGLQRYFAEQKAKKIVKARKDEERQIMFEASARVSQQDEPSLQEAATASQGQDPELTLPSHNPTVARISEQAAAVRQPDI